MKKAIYTSILLLIICKCLNAQWSTDPYNNLIVGYGLLPELCSDSAGGCYITYEQGTTYPRHLMLERLNRYGYKPWSGSKRITGLLEEQSSAKITEDGSGGVIVSYLDYYDNLDLDNPVFFYRLRVQRVDSSGNFLWGPTGVRVTLSETNQTNQAIVSDGSGGCIVAWNDGSSVFTQRIDSMGATVWGDSGVVIARDGSGSILMADDGYGGAIICWRYERFNRIDKYGKKLWSDIGINIPGGAGKIICDGNGFIYLQGRRFLGMRNGELFLTLNYQKIDTSGIIQWDSLGIVLDTLNTNSYINVDFSFQNGYSTIAWPQKIGGVWDLRTQIVRSDGNTVFPYGGTPINKTPSPKGIVGIIPSDSSNSIYVWFDERSPRGTYTQMLDTLGHRLWDTLDVLVSLPELSYEEVITDCNGGFIVVGSRENFTIRAQQVSKYGNLGEVITSIDDDIIAKLPQEFKLYQNYPNPFNPTTRIKYDLPKDSKVTLKVYNLLGQEVLTLTDEIQDAGFKSIEWNVPQSGMPSGVYFYRLSADAEGNSFTAVKKVMLLK
jgi:hypothetical protein